MRLLAIDPGNTESALLTYDTVTARPVAWSKCDNEDARGLVASARVDRVAIEMVASYGMPVGREVFETCVWIGRFMESWLVGWDHSGERDVPELVYRRDVKLHLCGSPRAKDGNIRQALIDRYGPGKERAVGLKRSPGPLYGMKADCWSALAVAITAAETPVAVAA